jgi:predicted DNA-binding protein (MmcQ/YjbR family)
VTRGELIDYCLGKPGAAGDFPFDDATLVVKVGGKMFALLAAEGGAETINLKCEPELAIDLRAGYAGIKPGWHMNKEHWNTVSYAGDLPEELLASLVDASYELVAGALSAKAREAAGLPPKAGRR